MITRFIPLGVMLSFLFASFTPAPLGYAQDARNVPDAAPGWLSGGEPAGGHTPAQATLGSSLSGLDLPAPGTLVGRTADFSPAVLRGLKIDPANPLRFDFLVDTGHSGLADEDLKAESARLIKYFLASLTVPEEDLWVNLAPYESGRIVPEKFGITEMGRDLLAQDYLLKQLTASLMYPEEELGAAFWQRVYEEARARYGTTEIPMIPSIKESLDALNRNQFRVSPQLHDDVLEIAGEK